MIDLRNSDCLEVMKSMADDSVDMVFTSPPYNMNLRIRTNSDGTTEYCSRQIVKELSTKYSNFPDNLPMDEYYEFNKKVITECLRISDLVFYNVQFLTGNKVALYRLIGDFAENLKEFIVWDKVNSQPAIGQGVLNSRFEAILVFQKSNAISRCFESANFERGTLENLWQIKRGKKIDPSHGASFPEELVEKAIKSFSKKGDVIFDPFLGTGTTGVVAKRWERDFIGVEMDQEYFQFAKERIDTTLPSIFHE